MEKIKLVTFDLDDTLYPEITYAAGGFRLVAETLTKSKGEPADRLADRMLVWHRAGRRDIFQTVLDELHMTASAERVAELINLFRTGDRPLQMYAEAERALTRIRSSCLFLAILTDGYLEAQKKKIQLLRLENRVDAIIYTDQYGRDFWKPNTRCFEMLMKKFKTAGPECVYIADNEA